MQFKTYTVILWGPCLNSRTTPDLYGEPVMLKGWLRPPSVISLCMRLPLFAFRNLNLDRHARRLRPPLRVSPIVPLFPPLSTGSSTPCVGALSRNPISRCSIFFSFFDSSYRPHCPTAIEVAGGYSSPCRYSYSGLPRRGGDTRPFARSVPGASPWEPCESVYTAVHVLLRGWRSACWP